MKLDQIKSQALKLLHTVDRIKFFLIAIVVILLCGYSLYQLSSIVAAGPDDQYLTTANNKLKHFQFDQKLLNSISNLQTVPQAPKTNLGKSDPFSG